MGLKNSKAFLILLMTFVPIQVYSAEKINKDSLDRIALNLIDQSLNSQVKSDNEIYLKGEWPTQITSTLVPAIVGVGKLIGKNEEETAFTTATVINLLAQIYLDNPSLQSKEPLSRVPLAIKDGVDSFKQYKEGLTYNFYPYTYEKGVKVRRPKDMALLPIWYGFTNIPNDADTTSSVYSALLYESKINQNDFYLSSSELDALTNYRDEDRNPMYYNGFYDRSHTGAYMTWLFNEKDPKMPRFFFASSEKGERIPFNKNDVDCVVNANVLKVIALSQSSNVTGQKESCALLNDMIEKEEHSSCGVYYPNSFNLSAALAMSEKAGSQCVTDRSRQKIVSYILSLQTADGYWVNDKNIWEDKIITTAFAMYALLHYGNLENQSVVNSILYGAHYLMTNYKLVNGNYIWKADHFFTATALARSLVMWTSPAYTNLILSSVFLDLNKKFPDFIADQYIKLKFY